MFLSWDDLNSSKANKDRIISLKQHFAQVHPTTTQKFTETYAVYGDEGPREIYHKGERGLLYAGRFASWNAINSSGADTRKINSLKQRVATNHPPTSRKISEFNEEDPQAALTPVETFAIISTVLTVIQFVDWANNKYDGWKEEQEKKRKLWEEYKRDNFFPPDKPPGENPFWHLGKFGAAVLNLNKPRELGLKP